MYACVHRWFLKEAGCKKLFERCDEKKVRPENSIAGKKVAYVVGKVLIFSIKMGPVHNKKFHV